MKKPVKWRVALLCGFCMFTSSAFSQNQAQQLQQQQQQNQQQQDQQRRNTEGWLQNQQQMQQQTPFPQPRQEPLTPPKRPGHWIKSWGAIADGSNGQGAGSSGYRSQADAESEMVKKCTEAGGVACRPVFVYYGQCVAVAHPGGRAKADTNARAESLVMEICEKHNPNGTCKIVFKDCAQNIYVDD